MTNFKSEVGRMERAKYTQEAIERRQRLDVEEIARAQGASLAKVFNRKFEECAGIEARKGLDIEALKEAQKILDGKNVQPIEREAQGRVLTLKTKAWEELDEMVLACLAAGVPASQILIKEPFTVVKGCIWQIEAGISFKEDYRRVRNEGIYQ